MWLERASEHTMRHPQRGRKRLACHKAPREEQGTLLQRRMMPVWRRRRKGGPAMPSARDGCGQTKNSSQMLAHQWRIRTRPPFSPYSYHNFFSLTLTKFAAGHVQITPATVVPRPFFVWDDTLILSRTLHPHDGTGIILVRNTIVGLAKKYLGKKYFGHDRAGVLSTLHGVATLRTCKKKQKFF